LRAITTPKRGIGHQTLAGLGAFASRYKVSLFEALFAHSLPTALPRKAVEALHEFGRFVNDWVYRAQHTEGAEAASAFMRDWLVAMDYEKHLYDSEDSEPLAAARWTNVLDFCEWMSQRCGGQVDEDMAITLGSEKKNLLEVVQTIALLSTLSEREKDSNVVTLSTLHAAKGLEWPHVVLVGVNEGTLPFKTNDADDLPAEQLALRLQEERRLMYVGITRAQRTLLVTHCRQRKKGRELVQAAPSRFIADMTPVSTGPKEDPREKLRALRAEFAKKAADTQS
jgi:ATP-dependent DNA helicase Rep